MRESLPRAAASQSRSCQPFMLLLHPAVLCTASATHHVLLLSRCGPKCAWLLTVHVCGVICDHAGFWRHFPACSCRVAAALHSYRLKESVDAPQGGPLGLAGQAVAVKQAQPRVAGGDQQQPAAAGVPSQLPAAASRCRLEGQPRHLAPTLRLAPPVLHICSSAVVICECRGSNQPASACLHDAGTARESTRG